MYKKNQFYKAVSQALKWISSDQDGQSFMTTMISM